ncbi:MED7 protein-domain-containing protein [Myxozyma melibiosi]|uniref:Mediator of RNA polymerase II transcription subunit 7 n=1 Tax=Myxozyma melibiosi TaxID=54550 RepID=A0ABR1FDN6_9ASCO
MDSLSSAFPPPPAAYTSFTTGSPRPQPPPLPGPRYRSFGLTWNTNDALPPLAAAGIKELFTTSADASDPAYRVSELSTLTRSLLIKYLELLGVMSTAPELFPPLVEDVRTILLNMHHLLNEYRPHQARESLILMMEEQLDRKRAQTEATKLACDRMELLLSSLTAPSPTDENSDTTAPDPLKDHQIDSAALAVHSESPAASARRADLRIWAALSSQQ